MVSSDSKPSSCELEDRAFVPFLDFVFFAGAFFDEMPPGILFDFEPGLAPPGLLGERRPGDFEPPAPVTPDLRGLLLLPGRLLGLLLGSPPLERRGEPPPGRLPELPLDR